MYIHSTRGSEYLVSKIENINYWSLSKQISLFHTQRFSTMKMLFTFLAAYKIRVQQIPLEDCTQPLYHGARLASWSNPDDPTMQSRSKERYLLSEDKKKIITHFLTRNDAALLMAELSVLNKLQISKNTQPGQSSSQLKMISAVLETIPIGDLLLIA